MSATVTAAAALAALAALAGCARTPGSAGANGPGTGALTGTVRTFGGPALNGTPAADGRPDAGTVVRFTRDGHPAGAATTDMAGRFTVRLPAGAYAVDACSWGRPTDHVTVASGSTLTHDFRCDVP